MKRFWISWYQPSEDYRPIEVPPVDIVPGYWCSGEEFGGKNRFIMCAVVCAAIIKDAEIRISEYWPEAEDWRFCIEQEEDWMPDKDRFPIK